MSDDRQVATLLKFNVDPEIQAKVTAATGTIKTELDKLATSDAFDQLAADAVKMAQETGDSAAAVKELNKELDRVGANEKEVAKVTTQFVRLEKAAKKAAIAEAEAAKKKSAQEFEKGEARVVNIQATKQQQTGTVVGLAGQAAGLAGAGEAGGALGLLGSSIGALGPVGVAATAATVALGIATSALTKHNEELRAEVERRNELIADTVNLQKLTTEELEAESAIRQTSIDDLKERIAAEEENLESQSLATTLLRGAVGGLADTLGNAGTKLGLVGVEAEAGEQSLESLNEELKLAEGGLENIDNAMGSTRVAANDAAAALEALNKQMSDDLLDSAGDAGEAIRAESAALDRSKEANLERIEAINRERAAIEAELAVLESQGSESEEVAKKIEQLTNKLGDLGAESTIVGNIASKQKSEVDKSTQSSKSLTVSVGNMTKALDEEKNKREELIKVAEDHWNDMLDIEFKAAQDREKIAIDANREQEKLMRDASDNFLQDFDQDFLGEFVNRMQLATDLRETQIGARQSFQDVDRQLSSDLGQARADALQDVAQTQNTNTFNFPGANPQQMLAVLQNLGITGR